MLGSEVSERPSATGYPFRLFHFFSESLASLSTTLARARQFEPTPYLSPLTAVPIPPFLLPDPSLLLRSLDDDDQVTDQLWPQPLGNGMPS